MTNKKNDFKNQFRFSKIVATLGPSSSTFETIESLFLAGTDIFRLNFSHGTQEDHKLRHQIIRQIETKYKRPIAILADLQGPKIRIGTFKNGTADLVKGEIFRFKKNKVDGSNQSVYLPHPEIFESIKSGDTIFVDDGRLRFKVLDTSKEEISSEILISGIIRDRKGVNLTTRKLSVSALTEKDIKDLDYSLDLGVDWVALSFVQTKEDVIDLKRRIAGRAKVISKIEKPSAIENIEGIIKESDAIMVARGDLGVEVQYSLVPSLQKNIIAKCRSMDRPVIVATQALESMINNSIPTRAETSDVATSLYDGADAVMLSAETASGNYPLEAVATMCEIIHYTEDDPNYWSIIEFPEYFKSANDPDTIASAACYIAKKRCCKTIATFTETGSTAIRVSTHRSPVPIVAITRSLNSARQLCLAWGVKSLVANDGPEMEANLAGQSSSFVTQHKVVQKGDRYVITSGTNYGKIGGTDHLRIVQADH